MAGLRRREVAESQRIAQASRHRAGIGVAQAGVAQETWRRQGVARGAVGPAASVLGEQESAWSPYMEGRRQGEREAAQRARVERR